MKMADEAPTCMRPNSVRGKVITRPINQILVTAMNKSQSEDGATKASWEDNVSCSPVGHGEPATQRGGKSILGQGQCGVGFPLAMCGEWLPFLRISSSAE